jgi:hypothetical protein
VVNCTIKPRSLKITRFFRRTYCRHLQGRRVSQARTSRNLAYLSILNMEEICSSETSGSLRTIRHYEAVCRTLQSQPHNNLNPRKINIQLKTDCFCTAEKYERTKQSLRRNRLSEGFASCKYGKVGKPSSFMNE